MDIAKLKIDQIKMFANGDEYFSLYEKYIPRDLGKDKLVLVYEIQNLDCIMNIISLNPEAGYIVVGNESSNRILKLMIDKKIDVQYLNSLELENCNMKFDCIIMNPPYSGNLHLKILTKAIKCLKNDGTCVCLHPSKWIRRFDYWKTKTIIPVKSASFLSDIESRNVFDAAIGSQLMITVAAKDGSFDYKKYSRFIPWVKEKIIDKSQWLFNNQKCPGKTTNPNEKFILNLPIVHGNIGCYDMTELTSKAYERALNCKFGKRPQDINSFAFNSEIERKNFYDSLFTNFYKFLIITCRDGQTATSCYYAIPWLGEATNPRTGLKGYQGEWTDDDLYLLFGISEDEKTIIEETMKKYTKTSSKS
jgi:hypothetical protein